MGGVFEGLEKREYYGVDELVSAADELIERLNSETAAPKVKGFSPRTVRFYLSDESGPLLPPPTKKGQMLKFGYADLIRLLVIRRFQAQGWHLKAMKSALEQSEVKALERIVSGEPFALLPSREEAEKLANSMGVSLEGNSVELQDSGALEEFLAEKEWRTRGFGSDTETRMDSTSAGLWKRITITPGLELNIGSHFLKSRSKKEKEELLRKIEIAIDDADNT